MMPIDSARSTRGAAGLTQPFGKGRFGDVFFNRANGNRFKPFFDHATAFAKPVLRADTATNFRKIIGLREDNS